MGTSPFSLGDAGNVNIDVIDTASFEGVDSDGFPSGIFTSVLPGGVGSGGNINIKAGSLLLRNSAVISASTFGQGDAGDVTITAMDDIIFDNNSRVESRVEIGATGKGGDIKIGARSLSITNGSQLNVNSEGQGEAGNIDVDADSFRLNKGEITAETTSGDGGNIRLRVKQGLGLRQSSRISTSAGTAQQPGNGGNIIIADTPFTIAVPNTNSDITANTFNGDGGTINISGLTLGFTPRSGEEIRSLLATDDPERLDPINLQSNDITAFSQTNPSLDTFSYEPSNLEPGRDIVELPTTPVDASTLVAAGCPSGAENRFVVAGRGGLPPAPGDKLSADALLTDWATLTTPESRNRAAVETTTPEAANTTTPLVEATTWQFGSKGEIILTNADSTIPDQFEATPSNCPSS